MRVVSGNKEIQPYIVGNEAIINSVLNGAVLSFLKISGLQLNSVYSLTIVGFSGKVEERYFRAANTNAPEFEFAFSTCMVDEKDYIEPIFLIYSHLAHLSPRWIILGGDAVYVDSCEAFPDKNKGPKGSDIWKRYVETWSRLSLYRMKYLIPDIATWDDHDFGTNDGNANFDLKEVSFKVFKTFYGAQDIPGIYKNCPGVSSVLEVSGQRLV